jgi:ABC-2 type transport system ATP-binding protein
MIIDHGRLAFDGELERLRAAVGADRMLMVELDRPEPPLALPGVEVVRVEGPRQWLRLPRASNAAALVAELAGRYEVRDIDLRETDIEEVVARLYRGDDAYEPPGRPVAP